MKDSFEVEDDYIESMCRTYADRIGGAIGVSLISDDFLLALRQSRKVMRDLKIAFERNASPQIYPWHRVEFIFPVRKKSMSFKAFKKKVLN